MAIEYNLQKLIKSIALCIDLIILKSKIRRPHREGVVLFSLLKFAPLEYLNTWGTDFPLELVEVHPSRRQE